MKNSAVLLCLLSIFLLEACAIQQTEEVSLREEDVSKHEEELSKHEEETTRKKEQENPLQQEALQDAKSTRSKEAEPKESGEQGAEKSAGDLSPSANHDSANQGPEPKLEDEREDEKESGGFWSEKYSKTQDSGSQKDKRSSGLDTQAGVSSVSSLGSSEKKGTLKQVPAKKRNWNMQRQF